MLAAGIVCTGGSCTPDNSFKTPEWETPDPKPDPVNPDPANPDNPGGGNEDPDTPVVKDTKPFYIWVDAAANFPDFANSTDNIRRDLGKAKETGFTDVVVDVRPTCGNVLFKTDKLPQVKFLGAWVGANYTKIERTADFDYLQAFIEIGHELGLRIHAGFNTMVAGATTNWGKAGPIYEGKMKSEWASTLNLQAGLTSSLDAGSSPVFLNPVNEEVQDYIVSVLEDLAAYEGLDGIILDRCRYDNLQSDYSEYSRQAFQKYLGNVTLQHWPQDVMPVGATYTTTASSGFKAPTYYKQWLEFRAKAIHDLVEKASDAVHRVHPGIKFGVYVGGWYSQYYDVGVNWASPEYNASSEYKWASKDYMKYGYADHCDHMLIGAYAAPTAVWGSTEWTMQGFCLKAKQKIGDACPLVAGGPDVGNWDSDNKVSPADENQAITDSVKACYDACDGYFLFDMIHLKKAQQWDYVLLGIKKALE